MATDPSPTVPPTDLPVEACIPALREALDTVGTAVLVAPPGAGKTTLVPLRLLDAPWLHGRRITVLEPRRLATRAAARRMATLLGDEVGGIVGYQTRDERRISKTTRIEVVTEGILTRRLQSDPELASTGLVVFDEIHERNLQTDLGLALALDARAHLRPDLRVLAMSATLDTSKVAKALGNGTLAPVVESEARQHPVDVRWAPIGPRDRLEPSIANIVRRALREEHGDVLVFLPGAAEIRRTADQLAGQVPGTVAVHPLYGMLSLAEQDLALAPSPPGQRRVVLATDIAETSLTVEGVRIVVDSGVARAPRFDVRTGMTRLRTIPISRASADQRAGRAGRTEPGVAYRLWSPMEHGTRRAQSDAEITQVDLAGLALELVAWGTDARDLRWLDTPPARTLDEGRSLLRELGALDADGHITAAGKAMAELPLHPRLARMVVDAAAAGLGPLACVVAALVEERDVLRGPLDELPVDLAPRVALVAGLAAHHPNADRRALGTVQQRARDLARRANIPWGPDTVVDPGATGRVLVLAYPDRLAVRRGSPGKVQMRTGSRAWLPATDPLAHETFVVAADLDGKRSEARVRLGAALDARDVVDALANDVEERRALVWDKERDDLVERVERRLGNMTLDVVQRRPPPGEATTAALLDRVRSTRLAALPWTDASRGIRQRVAVLRHRLGHQWPDWTDNALLRSLDTWLAPHLAGASSASDLRALDLTAILRNELGHARARELDRLAPTHLTLPSGRRVALDYADDPPVLAVRVQELFGTTTTPSIADGRVPLVLHLLSPAGRPIQVTSDLAGFWAGSWREARKEMAGRYPKHHWPEDPATATPDKPR